VISKQELAEIRASTMRMVKGDDDPDPIIRLFNKHRIAEGAQLRRAYAELVEAREQFATFEAKEIAVQQEHYRLGFRRQAMFRPDDDGPALPPDGAGAESAALREQMELTAAYHEYWRGRREDAQRRANEAGKDWQSLRQTWRNVKWQLTGDEAFAPPARLGDWQRPNAAKRAELEAQLQRVES
jgi:hypothetical protein